VIRVADSGIGMDDETRSRAFEPFFTTKDEAEGSGLGLSSVYGTVAQSGGFVLLETNVGEGSTFSLHLPVAAAPLEAKTRTILLAEDEDIVRDLTEQILKNAGYQVLTAGDGAKALALYEEHRAEIDGVVTDIVMPGLGGRGLARQIREHDADLPIVFISGHHEETPETLQLGTGAALLQKPFSVDALVDTIGRLVGDEQPENRPAAVLKEGSLESLEEAVRAVADGGTWVDPGRARAVASPADLSNLPPLTPREREILGLVANGLTNEKVATALAISPETVQSHVRHAMVKLEADTRTEAVATALRHSLIS
jgi:DNA-binding NarL/FixJ family response regulator